MSTFQRVAPIVLMFSISCGGGGATDEPPQTLPSTTDPLAISTVNYPLAFIAERVGGDLVEVHFPAPADEDPAYWSPDAETIAAFQRADLILLHGAGYAGWVHRATLPDSKLVDTSAAYSDRLIPLQGETTHSHGPEGEHEHVGWAFTTWLDPELAIRQAHAVATAITRLRPNHETELNDRLTALENELQGLDRRFAAAAEVIGDSPLLFSHPVYQYLIRRYGLNGVEVHWEPDENPDGRAWDHLERQLETHPARWMLWEGEPLEDTVAGLRDLGVGSLLFDPCGNVPESGDYLAVMAANAGSLETIAETLDGK